MQDLPYAYGVTTSLRAQTPASAFASDAALVEYWVGRMIGYRLSDEAMAALAALSFEAGPRDMGAWEQSFAQKVIATIAAAPEFVLR